MSVIGSRNRARRWKVVLLVAWLTLQVVLPMASADDAIPKSPSPRWWKGNIHTHSLWSDGDDFPEMIAEWYRTHGYNFLALSDHNVLSDGIKFMKRTAIESRGGKDVIAKYKARFGNGWVESKGDATSDEYSIRIKPLNEFRALVEERGKFIMIAGEEISDRAEGVPIHMNATNVKQLIEPVGGQTVREVLQNNLRAVEAQAEKTGREILLHLNHPNFGNAITAEDIAAVIQERFFEVYNGHPAVGHLGDEQHPGVERLWDIANTLRIGELNAPPIFGVATDDSHNYHGKPDGASTCRGWVMVRASYLTPERLLRAMKAGDFYASSGVRLADVRFDQATQELTIWIDAQGDETYQTQFVGTRRDYDASTQSRISAEGEGEPKRLTRKYSSDVGAVLATATGSTASYRLRGDELYVRAVITSSAAHTNPSFEGQLQQAWTQPVVVTEPSTK